MSSTTIKSLQITWVIIVVLIITFLVSTLFSNCKRPVKPVEPVTQTEQIISAYNPIIDSLAKQNYNLKYENDSLKDLTYKLTHKRRQFKASYHKQKVNMAVAEAKNDTSALVTSLKQQVADCDEYMQTTDQQLTVQGSIIENLEKQNKNITAGTEMFKRSLKVCADENSTLLAQNKIYEKQLQIEKQRKKAWRKAAGGALLIAVVEGIILSL